MSRAWAHVGEEPWATIIWGLRMLRGAISEKVLLEYSVNATHTPAPVPRPTRNLHHTDTLSN